MSESRRLLADNLQWVLVALLIRLLFMPFAMHSDPGFTGDIAAMNYASRLLVHPTDTALPGPTTYPPLAHYTMALFQDMLRPVIPPLADMPVAEPGAMMKWVSDPGVFRYLFILKSWYLIFDFGTAFLLAKLVTEKENADQIFRLWIFNPIIIYDGYIHGQFNVVLTFFIVLSLLWVQRGRLGLSALSLGIAACYKNFPLLFLPPLVLLGRKSAIDRLKVTLVAVVPYALLILPRVASYIPSMWFYDEYFFPLRYEPGFRQAIIVFVAAYAVLVWWIWEQPSASRLYERLWRSMLLILLLYYVQAAFDLHYLSWAVPLAILQLLEDRRAVVFHIVLVVCSLLFFVTVPLGLFLLPISPDFFGYLPSILEIASPYLPMSFGIDVVRSVFVGTLLWLAYRVFRQMANGQEPEIIES